MNLRSVEDVKHKIIGRTLETSTFKKQFRVVDVTSRGIVVKPNKSKADRPIPIGQVDQMGSFWSDFKAGRVKRGELANATPKNFNTSYLEVIFHEVERQQA